MNLVPEQMSHSMSVRFCPTSERKTLVYVATYPTSILMVTLPRTPRCQKKFRQLSCTNSLSWIGGAAVSKKWSQLSICSVHGCEAHANTHTALIRHSCQFSRRNTGGRQICIVLFTGCEVRGTTSQSVTKLRWSVSWGFVLVSSCT